MKEDEKKRERILTDEEIEWLEQLKLVKKARAKKDEPRTPIVVTLKARVEIPTSWIDVYEKGIVDFKDDDEKGIGWFFIGLTRWEGIYLVADADFGLDCYYETDEPYIELDDDAEWDEDDECEKEEKDGDDKSG